MDKVNNITSLKSGTGIPVFSIAFLVFIKSSTAQTFITPEAFNYKQEIFCPVSYYTGQANISIPLIQIKTGEITIPVSVDYIGGEGLRPINPYSNAGLGWKLSAGGAITRTINGQPDEITAPPAGELKGFFSITPNYTNNEAIRNNAYTFIDSDGLLSINSQVEFSPDIFSFNFLGYSGYFVMGYDKVFKINSQDIVNAEFFRTSFTTIGSVIYFRLTSNDGTKFTFGSEEGSIELSGGENAIPFQSHAWYLTRIDFTNGRSVIFNYHPNKDIRIHYKTSQYDNYSTISPVVPDNITFQGGKVVFISTYMTQRISGLDDNLRLINRIELQTSEGKKVSQVFLKHSSKIFNRYHILDSLRIDDKRYSFGYNNTGSLPDVPDAYGTDYWGFYNGQPELTGRISPGFRDVYLNQYLTHPQKTPSESHSKLGILTSVTYPTGDAQLFEYEANTYSYAGIQTLGGYYHSFSEEPKTAGGLRISKITIGNQIRKYRYVNSFDPNNPDNTTTSSSGILYKFPSVCYMTAEALNFLSIEGEPPITYHRVIEFLSDKSYTVYDFNSPLNKPDGENSQNTNYYDCWASNPAIFSMVPKSVFIGALGKNSSCALERGQIKEIRFYNSSNTLKRKVNYTYSSNSNRFNDYVASLYYNGTSDQRLSWLAFELGQQYLGGAQLYFMILHSYCIYTFPVYLEKEEITDYFGAQPITNITKYGYNDKKLKSTVVTYNSRGDSLKTIIRYPSDINAGVYASMKTLSMLNFPVEQITIKNNKFTGSTLTTYKANGTGTYFYVPDKVYSLEITSPLTSFNNFNGSSRDSHYGTSPDISYNSYSPAGNLRQMTGRDNTAVSYLWDVNGIYPLAQVKGASYSQISSLDGKACDYPSITLWSGLNSLASTALISTYSYKPLTGISSFTNPQGVTTYYTYDVSGRLFLVRDDDKNILNRYRYGYRNYPDNGMGGYSSLTGYISAPSIVTMNTTYTSTGNISGGTGSFSYNWYLKNSSGTVIASNLNSTSNIFSFTCTQTGSYYIQCEITDNLLGKKLTRTSSSFTCCVSVCSFTMNYGYIDLSTRVLNFGSTVSFYMAFYPTSTMQPNVSYLVGYIGSPCRPSGSRIFNINSVMGRTWEITIDSYGYVYWRMTSGEAMPEYYSESTGTLTYNL